MFSYFGRKLRTGLVYPKPQHSLVIEPFAGSMAYSLLHRPEKALGIEANPLVVETWHRICSLSEQEITDYPTPELGETTNDHWLIQAAFSEHSSEAKERAWNVRMVKNIEAQKKFAIKHLEYANTSIEYALGSYKDAPDIEATWFIDPPYQHVTKGYLRSDIDYSEIAEFCVSRKGQVIVCEQEGADWLPFKYLTALKGGNNKYSNEMVWTNS